MKASASGTSVARAVVRSMRRPGLTKRVPVGRTSRVDRALVGVTRAANYSRLWLALSGLLALFGGVRGRVAARSGVEAIALAAAVANGPAKLLVRRRRPLQKPGRMLIAMPRSTSFPSGHSATAFAFATATSRELPVVGVALVPLAGAVSYSRVHIGVHYPSDVVAGIAIGVGCGLVSRDVGGWMRLASQWRRRRSTGP